MKKILGAGLIVVIVLLLVVGLTAFLPKYSGFLRFLFFFLLFDAGLWFSVRRSLEGFSIPARLTITFLYWSPLLIAVTAMITAMFIPFLTWPIPFRTYLASLLLCLFVMKIFPMTAWLVTMAIRSVVLLVKRFHTANVTFKSMGRPGLLVVLGWISGFVVFIAMVAGMVFGQYAFRVRKQEIALRNLPDSFNGFRIVQVSDIHLGSWTCREKLAEAVDSINNLRPDVIFFTGDMFNYRTDEGRDFGEILSRMKASCGIFAIMGNHDYGDYISWASPAAKEKNLADLKSWYRQLGWNLLLNSNSILRRGADSIAVIGVQNWGSTRRFQRLGDVRKAQEGTEKMAVQLLLSHDPSHWDQVISQSYHQIDVTFSGHTHGGQVGIETERFSWSPSSWAYPHWQGLYRSESRDEPQFLYVNKGLGSIGYAGRIGILPEITLVILKKQLN